MENFRPIDFPALPVISSGSKATREKMSSIYFIRHGQASFGNQNYDRLSELGRRQCRLLGEWFARFGVRFDAAYSGDLERQRDSAAQVAEAYAAAGLDFPEPVIDPAWNEYDSQAILSGSVPAAMAANPEIASLAKDMMTDGRLDLVNNKKAFQRLFSRIMELWVDGKLNAEGYERWPDFVGRVSAGIDRVRAEQGGGRTVAVFTSGGPISAVMRRAVSAPDRVALDLGWVIANSSFTECRYSGAKFGLAAFNLTPHLTAPDLVTYR